MSNKAILTLAAFFVLTIQAAGQTVTRNFSNMPLQQVLEVVESQTGYSFVFDPADLESSGPAAVTASFKNAGIREVLDKILGPSLKYSISGKIVSISRQSPPAATQQKNPSGKKITVSGTVISSSDNQPLVGAGVVVDNTTIGTVTDLDGNFTLTIPADAQSVSFNCLGYQSKQILVKDVVLMRLVSLSEDTNMLEDAVVVGFGVQKKESVVGAVQAIKPDELNYPSSNLTASFAGKIAEAAGACAVMALERAWNGSDSLAKRRPCSLIIRPLATSEVMPRLDE